METITRSIQVFPFSELTSAAKETARQWNAETMDNSWSESVIEDAKSIAALMGWEITNVFWSGFSSQGDGAQFVGSMYYAKGCARAVKSYAPTDSELHSIASDWQALQSAHFYKLSAKVYSEGRYCHEYCTRFEMSDYSDRGEDETMKIARRFMRWIYRQLEKEYDYQTSNDALAETAEANNWRFTANGAFFGGKE